MTATVEELLEKIKVQAKQKTVEKIMHKGNNPVILLVTILSEIYSLEALVEEYIKMLDRAGTKK